MASDYSTTPKHTITALDYEKVGASATAQALGPTGAAGDILHGIFAETIAGNITILDNATTLLVFTPPAIGFYELNIKSIKGAWKISTAAATTCLAIGKFS